MMYDYKLQLVIRTPQACLWEQSDKDDIHIMHYDNLLDYSKSLKGKQTY